MAQAKTTTSKKSSTTEIPSKATVRKVEANVDKVSDSVKETALAGLGLYGKVYDEVQDRIDSLRKETPKKWDEFVKRGEQLSDTANEKVNDIRFGYKFDMEEQRAQFRDVVEAVKAFIKPSKA